MRRSLSLALALASVPFASPAFAQDAAKGTDPNLAVASVRMEDGYRASKLIGTAVFNANNEQIGAVDDLILNRQNQVVLAVISVGGFLGVGGKLVAIPYGQIQLNDAKKLVLADANKDTLNKMPSFTYGP